MLGGVGIRQNQSRLEHEFVISHRRVMGALLLPIRDQLIE